METLIAFADMFLHVDKYLDILITQYGSLAYAVLFAIVFIETGLVVMPFLPGDSLLFLAGALAAAGAMDPVILSTLLFIAAVLGNTLNYWIGHWIGPKIFEKNYRFLDKDALKKTHDFYQHHGGKTIVIARFVPIVRTFAPFVAGVSRMDHHRFQLYNILGAFVWVVGLVAAGYFFGNLPWVKDHLNTIILVGIGAAIVPLILAAAWKSVRGIFKTA
jgi:membrane-associated protein